jgi:superfamily I DNA/RNA helicase
VLALHRRVGELLSEDRVDPQDVVILVAGKPKARYFQLLRGLTLPKGVQWAFEDHLAERSVLVETVARFKGLERAVVILWGVDDLDLHRDRETLYVGISRAKGRLLVVGSDAACRGVAEFRMHV